MFDRRRINERLRCVAAATFAAAGVAVAGPQAGAAIRPLAEAELAGIRGDASFMACDEAHNPSECHLSPSCYPIVGDQWVRCDEQRGWWECSPGTSSCDDQSPFKCALELDYYSDSGCTTFIGQTTEGCQSSKHCVVC